MYWRCTVDKPEKDISQDNVKRDPNHQFESNKKYYIISIYAVITIAVSAIIIKLVFSFEATSVMVGKYFGALTPVVAGFFIAYLLNPMVNFFDRSLFTKAFSRRKPHPRLSRSIAMLFSYIIVIGAIAVILIYLLPQLSSSITDLINKLQVWYSKAYDIAEDLHAKFPSIDFNYILDKVQETFNSFLSTDRITAIATSVIPTLFSTVGAVLKTLYYLLFSIMVSVYVLADKNRLVKNLKRFVRALFKPDTSESIIKVGAMSHRIFSSFIAGKSLDSLIIGILCFIVLSVFRMPFALLISIIVGITNMIPYVGPWIGAIPGFFIICITDPFQSLIYALLILGLQQFDGIYLGPKILGSSTGLRPVWIIFAISIGGAMGNSVIGSALGMFLGVPTIAVIANLLDKWIDKRILFKYPKEQAENIIDT